MRRIIKAIRGHKPLGFGVTGPCRGLQPDQLGDHLTNRNNAIFNNLNRNRHRVDFSLPVIIRKAGKPFVNINGNGFGYRIACNPAALDNRAFDPAPDIIGPVCY